MTLNDLLQECARNTYNTKVMLRGTSGYTGRGLEYATRFLSGINEALNMICRERSGPTQTETVTVDEYGRFLTSSLTEPFLRIRSIFYDNNPITNYELVDNLVKVPDYAGAALTVKYEYLPDELTLLDLDNEVPIDPAYVSPRILCQYANYQFLSEEGTEYDSARAQVWLSLFNNSFTNMTSQGLPKRVRYTG